MKNKSILMVMLTIAMVLALSGCGAKTAITATDFNAKIQEKGFTVIDATSQVQEGTVNAISMASKNDNSYQVEFYELPTVEAATSTFTGNKTQASDNFKGTSKEKSDKTWNSYYITTDDTYIYMSVIDNTFLYVKADIKYKSEIEKIIKSLRY